MGKVYVRSIVVVGPERAARTTLLPVRPQHEVIDEKLTLAAEQVGEGEFSFGPFKDITLVDPHPGQLAPLARKVVAQSGECLLLLEVSLASDQPLLAIDDTRFGHGNPPSAQATRDRNAVSFSSDSLQPQRWLSAPVRSRNRLWVKVSSVRRPAGLKSSATVVSCSR